MGNIYLEDNFSKKKITIIVAVCIVIMVIAILCIVIFSDGVAPSNNAVGNDASNFPINSTDKVVEKETDAKLAQTLFDFVPKMYSEELAPFTDYFMLEAAMDKVNREQEPDFSASHIDDIVKKIFGQSASINKSTVSSMDVSKCVYYYYAEDDKYYAVPMGFGNLYTNQYLNKATIYGDTYYLYVYSIVGEYYIEDTGAVTVVIGNKEGVDIIKKFASYDEFIVYSDWTMDYKGQLPMYRYSIKTMENGDYYLTALEQINY